MTQNEKFLDKVRRSDIKGILLGKLTIPKTNEEFNEKADEGKKMMKIFDYHELAHTELVLFINVKTSSGKVVFNGIKRCKNQEYIEGNSAISWGRVKNEYEIISSPSLVKTKRMLRQSSSSKNEDPYAWITTLEVFEIKLEDMGSENDR